MYSLRSWDLCNEAPNIRYMIGTSVYGWLASRGRRSEDGNVGMLMLLDRSNAIFFLGRMHSRS